MAYEPKEYKAIINPSGGSFRNPRQKMWGIFITNEKKGDTNIWVLIHMSNDFESAKDVYNGFLQNPDVKDPKLAGMDNIIFTEILPVDSKTRV
jgi:hypothetical protein